MPNGAQREDPVEETMAENRTANRLAPPEVLPPPQPPENLTPEVNPEEEILLETLANLWKRHQDHGLSTRHMMGKLLNQQYGPPTDKQVRGRRVITLAAMRLGISEPDLSRMRWLAHLFQSIEEMKAKHPGITSWTEFKEQLPNLRNQGSPAESSPTGPGDGSQETPNSGNGRTLKKVERSLTQLAANLREIGASLQKEERGRLIEKLREIGQVLEETLQLRLEVKQMRKPTANPLPPGSDTAA
jgi:hypothetical protein